jgi:hypothetical protein
VEIRDGDLLDEEPDERNNEIKKKKIKMLKN